jgi:predicted cupin superfamily sugar epimerase
MPQMTAAALIDALDLVPHPEEGGYFRETWRAAEAVAGEGLPLRYGDRGGNASRCFGTAIYYLLTPDTFSHLHRLRSDEVFHFYLGDAVEMLHLAPGGTGRRVVLGCDIAAGERPQVVVPAGVWQGARLVDGGAFALLGCTVAPGFDFADYEHGRRADLLHSWSAWSDLIETLTTP